MRVGWVGPLPPAAQALPSLFPSHVVDLMFVPGEAATPACPPQRSNATLSDPTGAAPPNDIIFLLSPPFLVLETLCSTLQPAEEI